MPVEIRELEIRGNVQDNQSDQVTNTSNNGSISKSEREAIIQECIERMLEILEKQRGR